MKGNFAFSDSAVCSLEVIFVTDLKVCSFDLSMGKRIGERALLYCDA